MWRVKKVRVCKLCFFQAWFWAFEMKKKYIDIYLKEQNYVYSAKLGLGTKYDFLVLLTVKLKKTTLFTNVWKLWLPNASTNHPNANKRLFSM